MDFTKEELDEIRSALEYLHDADLSDYGEENIRNLESATAKLNIDFESQL